MTKTITTLLLILTSMATIGCGDEPKEQDGEEAAKVLLGTWDTYKQAGKKITEKKEADKAAEKKSAPPFVGNWKLDIDATLAGDSKIRDMPAEQKELMKASFASMKLNFEITADGKMNMITQMDDQAQRDTATWQLLSSEGTTHRLKTVDAKDNKTEIIEISVTGDKLVASKEGQSFFLTRK